MAVLSPPLVLFKSAAAPNAVFSSAVLKRSVPAPVAVLKLPLRCPRAKTNQLLYSPGQWSGPKGRFAPPLC